MFQAGTPVQAWLAGVYRDKPTWISPCISVIESKETIALYNKAMHRGDRRVGVEGGSGGWVEGKSGGWEWRVGVEGGSGGWEWRVGVEGGVEGKSGGWEWRVRVEGGVEGGSGGWGWRVGVEGGKRETMHVQLNSNRHWRCMLNIYAPRT